MKFGVREICDVVFKAKGDITLGTQDFVAGQPVLYIDTAKTSTLEGAATTVYATGGKGNTRLLAWEGEKTLTFTVEDAMLSPLGFSVLTGAGLLDASAGTPIIVHAAVEVIADASGSVSITASDLDLSATEKATLYSGGNAKIYGTLVDSMGAALAYLGEGTANGTTVNSSTSPTISFNSRPAGTNLVAGTSRVVVDLYVSRTSNTQELQIEAGTFGGFYYVEASTLFRDQSTGNDLQAEIILPKVKIQSNFTFAMAATGDPSTFSFVMDAFPDVIPTSDSSNKVLCAIQIVADNDAA